MTRTSFRAGKMYQCNFALIECVIHSIVTTAWLFSPRPEKLFETAEFIPFEAGTFGTLSGWLP